MKTETQVNAKFTKLIRKGVYETYLVYCGHNWGRGATLTEAIKAAKVHPANEFSAVLFRSNEPIEAWVTDGGNWKYETETDEAVVTHYEIDDISNWFAGDNVVYQLWELLCTELRKDKTPKGFDLANKFEDTTNRMIGHLFED